MNKKQHAVSQIVVVAVCVILLTAGTIIVVNDKADLYICITELEWIETDIGSGETYADFRFYSYMEIWNRLKENVTILTTHWNLITINMQAELDDKSLKFVYSDIFIGILNTHIIEPGISFVEKSAVYEIQNYNQSNPPDGEYTVWAEFDGETEYDVKIYKTTIKVKNNVTEISYQRTPSTWGTTQYWTPLATSLLASSIGMAGIFVSLTLFLKKRKIKV